MMMKETAARSLRFDDYLPLHDLLFPSCLLYSATYFLTTPVALASCFPRTLWNPFCFFDYPVFGEYTHGLTNGTGPVIGGMTKIWFLHLRGEPLAIERIVIL
jgi:hypothetical protein